MSNNFAGRFILYDEMFELDQNRDFLIQTQNANNQFPVRMLDRGYESRSGFYHIESKRFISGNILYEYCNETVACVSIPEQVLTYPHRMSIGSIRWLNSRSNNARWLFLMIDDQISQQLNGKLPRIMFNRQAYIVDVEQLELRMESDPSKVINLQNKIYDLLNCQYLYFHIPSHKVIEGKLISNFLRNEVEILEIPNLSALDNLRVAKKLGLSPTASLVHYPPNVYHYIRKFSLAQTG